MGRGDIGAKVYGEGVIAARAVKGTRGCIYWEGKLLFA